MPCVVGVNLDGFHTFYQTNHKKKRSGCNTIRRVPCRHHAMLFATISDKCRRDCDYRKRNRKVNRNSNMFGLIVVLILTSITISLSAIIGVVMSFQPLLNSNHFSSLQQQHHSRRYHPLHHPCYLHMLEYDSSGQGKKFMKAVAHASNNSMHPIDLDSTEADEIVNKKDSLSTGAAVSMNATSYFDNDSSTTQYQPKHKTTSTQQQSFSFKDQIQKCKDSVNIIDVIESYQLEQFHRTSTDRAMAICPFHDDHHPSLHIDATKQIYKCFACNAGGDVIHFVQEYSKLPMNGLPSHSELSFLQALQYIQHKFGDGTTMTVSKPTYDSTIRPQETTELLQIKERILLANAYAALYFTNCLKESYAGGARYYLTSVRGLSLPVIKTMMIGYAPDTYYDPRFSSSMGTNRLNSLVNHLLQSGFTSREILDSGLAVMRKNHLDMTTPTPIYINASLPINSTEHNSVTPTKDTVWQNSSLLMDRFRGRIMVPILDETGTIVLGFGGRIIPLPEPNEIDTQSFSTFKAAKYLNSPESVVFGKRKILFNQHIATKAIHTRGRTSNILPLLLVEGYMDAISLWEIGIYNVAATMGTAISIEQLDQASKTAGCRGGKIVLCLDNDDAGTTAMERLCRNGMLEECIRKNVVSVYVARLPDQIKDPADFIESRRSVGMTAQQIATNFRNEVVQTAVDWTEWYIQNLISGYDRDAPRSSAGSFSDVFERIADFLANSLTPAERTKVAYEVAGQLSSVLASNRNSSEISLSVRIQLESDLIDLAARLSAAKEVLQRRIDAASTDATTIATKVSATVASFTSGLGPNSIDQDSKLSMKARRANISVSKPLTPIMHGPHSENNYQSSVSTTETLPHRKAPTTRARATISRTREPNYVSVTTHFSGFQFQHQSDMDWLGLQNSKYKKAKKNALILGQSHQSPTKGLGDTATPRDKHVYFNSAGFNGYQFLTDTAKNAGYATRSFKPDASLIENGLASIVEQDVRNMIESAENTLLRILVNDSTARSVVKNMLTARQAVNFGGDIKWSTSDKQWLFDLLVYGVDASSDTCITESDRYELRYVLSHHPTAPPGAFSPMDVEPIAQQGTLMSSSDLAPTDKLDRVDALVELAQIDENSEKKDLSRKLQSSIGTLDTFFEDEIITNERFIHDNIIEGTRNELAVQETLVSLLWASAALKSENIRAELVSYSNSLNENNLLQVKKIGDSSNAAKNHILVGSIEQAVDKADQQLRNITYEIEDKIFTFDKYQSELLAQLRDTTCTLHALKESSNRIALRLLDESSSTGVEGSISHSLQVDLASKLDDHVRDVLQHDLYPEPGINDIPYEIELEKMAEEWGDWYDDDYVWTPGESSKVTTMNQLTDTPVVEPESDIDRETLEDFFERVDREWNGWDS